MRFARAYLDVFLHPSRTFAQLLNEPGSLRLGLGAVSISAAVYTLVYIFLIQGGGLPFHPWLNIPSSEYYKYNVFFCAPSMLLGWILASGVIHLLTRLICFNGQFEQITTLLGFSIGVASWSTGLHDVITSFLGAIHVIDQNRYEFLLNSPTFWRSFLWIQMTAYFIWFLFLFSTAVRKVYHLPAYHAFWIGLFGFITYQGFFLIFNR